MAMRLLLPLRLLRRLRLMLLLLLRLRLFLRLLLRLFLLLPLLLSWRSLDRETFAYFLRHYAVHPFSRPRVAAQFFGYFWTENM